MGICCIRNPTTDDPFFQEVENAGTSIVADLCQHQFKMLKVIGKGKYGKVYLARNEETGELLAIKSILNAETEGHHSPLIEKTVLEQLNSDFIVRLKHAIETESKIHMALEYMAGGELFFHMRHRDLFSEHKARFYIAEVILAIEYLHSKRILYRDLKPENILLGLDGHIKLSDFGLSKIMHENVTYSFCGTAEYIAPEVITEEGYDLRADIWSIGAVLYELILSRPPFYHKDQQTMFCMIVEEPLVLPPRLSKNCADLLSKLLDKNPDTRLVNFHLIKMHPFFKSINWDRIAARKAKPPFRPPKSTGDDVVNFDKEFTSEVAANSPNETIEGIFVDYSQQSNIM